MKLSSLESFSVRAADIAKSSAGTLFGNPDAIATCACALNEPYENGISFIETDKESKVIQTITSTPITILFTGIEVASSDISKNKALIKVKDPKASLFKFIREQMPTKLPHPGINEKADVHPSAKIGNNVSIGPFSSIGEDCVIEDDVIIYPQVVVYPKVSIGAKTIIHSGAVLREGTKIAEQVVVQNGAVIGADGFGYLMNQDLGRLEHLPQVGTTLIGKRVEVGANTCVDRAAIGTTQVGADSKLDNLVQVGHNVKIGSNTMICGQTGIGGSAEIGSQVILGGRVGVADHVEIPDNCRVAGHSGVQKSLKEQGDYAGFPIEKAKSWRKRQFYLGKLSDMYKTLKHLSS